MEEKIESLTALTGVFPIRMIVSEETQENLMNSGIPPISEFDKDLQVTWFIPRKVTIRKTKNDKTYYVLEVVDSNNDITQIRCWGANPDKDHIQRNRTYIAKLDYNDQWGFSTRSIYHNFRVL